MILVIGDYCLDCVNYGNIRRICPEAPVPLFDSLPFSRAGDGMSGNVVNNLKSLDVECQLIANKRNYETKTRYYDDISGQLVFRVDEQPEYNHESDVERFSKIVDSVEFDKADAVIVSDYNKRFFAETDLSLIHERFKGPIFIDTKKPLGDWLNNVTCVKVNEAEWMLSGHPDMDNLCVTHGQGGAKWQGECYSPPKKVYARDVCGAGDAFLAALAAYYVKNGGEIKSAIKFAVRCATEVVQEKGVTTIPREMREFL